MSFFGGIQKVGCAVCTPVPMKHLSNGQRVLEPIAAEWHRKRMALSFPTNFNMFELFADGMEVGVARTKAVQQCLSHDPIPEFIFFLDYDVLPHFDALTKLFFRARCFPNIDMFAGVYCCKWMNPCDPLIYQDPGCGPFWDWSIGDLLTTQDHGIRGIHMGLTLIRTSLFQKMLDADVVNEETPFFYTSNEKMLTDKGVMKTRRGTEDIWFCELARKVDAQIMVDTSVLAGHIDKNSGITYGLPSDCPPVLRAHWLRSGRPEQGPEKKALDLGAGSTRREWENHQTFTTDIRAESDPDYIMDTRMLNLPDDEFDLVASSHHLEHIPRWEQSLVWQEMFRVCKPGGSIEHIVPSIEWAAAKIVNNDIDGAVYNVLYGAQEAQGYNREWNTHYFGFTKDVAKELCHSVGFTDVHVMDWRDDANLTYNLIIRAKKPISTTVDVVESNGKAVPTIEEDDAGEVFSQPNCPFNYCPYGKDVCKEECRHAIKEEECHADNDNG